MKTNKIIIAGLFVAFGVLFPIIFHSLGLMGKVFLPMHIPVLIGGFLLGPIPGLVIGIFTPILSSVFTGMPPVVPMLPIMIVELGIYGFAAGFLSEKFKLNTYITLVFSMILGRLGTGMVVYILVKAFNLQLPKNPLIYVKTAIITGVPGIIIQLVFIPIIIHVLKKHYKVSW